MTDAQKVAQHPVGALNWYECNVCNALTVTVHQNVGITPSRIGCLATPGCEGLAASAQYPRIPLPPRPHVLYAWFKPDIAQVVAAGAPPTTVAYLEQNGLLLRPIVMTPKLRAALARQRDSEAQDLLAQSSAQARARLAGFGSLPRPVRRAPKLHLPS